MIGADYAQPEQGDGQTARQAPKGSTKYVAVVLFHGMGQQRHYELLAQVVESVDEWLYIQHRSDPGKFLKSGLLKKTRRELIRGEDNTSGDDIVYIQADYGSAGVSSRVRFYEGYWAPAATEGTTARSVLLWLLAQMTRPFKVLSASWREFDRLRRADLIGLALTQPTDDEGLLSYTARSLIKLYSRFVEYRGPENKHFKDFVAFIKRELGATGKSSPELALAHQWRRRHLARQLRNALTLLGIGCSVAATLLLFLLGCFSLLREASGWIRSATSLPWLEQVALSVEPDLNNTLALATLLAAAFGVRGFLCDAVGDVQQFVTYEEAEPLHARRAKILAAAERTLRHVLNDDCCERVVVAAHSLGTAVALDTILRLRAFNQASLPTTDAHTQMYNPLPLNKIQHFITCGSPIDKINYFFATLQSQFRSYETMVDDLRGDIGCIPFSKSGRQPYVHWVNFWDRGDPVSGPLETVLPREVRVQRVDNVRIASYPWPDPVASHGAYFFHCNVIAFLFGVAFRNDASFATPPRLPIAGGKGARPDYVWQGPGTASAWQSALLLLLPVTAVVVIWTAIGVLAQDMFAPTLVQLGVLIALLVGGALVQRCCFSHRAPISCNKS